jgi:hypothetical protein
VLASRGPVSLGATFTDRRSLCPSPSSLSPTIPFRFGSSVITSSRGVAGEANEPGTWTLQLVLDQGAWEEVLTVDPDDADNLQDMLSTASVVHYDVRRRTLMFGTTPVGSA